MSRRGGCATVSPVRTRILIVDDHAPFRSFARALLRAEGFDVVGEAGDAASAVEAVARLQPELVLLDVRLPDGDGFEVAGRIASQPQPPVVVLCSSRDAASYRRRLAETPARGFIAKRELTGAALREFVP
jgi:DNA-binding NarL/FixJ family response regulator